MATRRRILPALLSFARLLCDATAVAAARARGLRAEVVELEAKLGRVTAERDLLLARFGRVAPIHRPRYKPFERFRILWHKARHRLSLKRTATAFLIGTTTLSTWLRAARAGLTRLFLPAKPKRRRDLVGETAALLRWQNPSWGTRRIADVLVRLGLKTSRPSIQRKLRRLPPRTPLRLVKPARKKLKGIRARYAHHVWVADFTRLSWLFGLVTLQVGAVIDAFSRKIVAIGISEGEPTARWTIQLLSRAISWNGTPKHFISDHGTQFTSKRMKAYLKRHGVRWRHGAVGNSGSISMIERLWRTLKCEWATIWLCWAAQPVLERRLREWALWFNEHRVHRGIGGRTPIEVEEGRRRRTPRRVKAEPGDRWVLEREELFGQKTMPVYRMRRTA
ncbi:MAG: DDE-type integrase/transposase/recombinase [Planctomycetia bacterium]|nr:DDE-type integrase/transposase/recombinase [Planctomycetia bacterium]